MDISMDEQQRQIDELLERHLGLLDAYTTLRQQLSALQAGIYQDIARANFAAERGVRYGMDHYDERMRAGRRVDIARRGDGVPVYAVRGVEEEEEEEKKTQEGSEEKKKKTKEGNEEKKMTTQEENQHGPEEDRHAKDEDEDEDKEKGCSKRPGDPLRWFGLLAPPALRSAQARAVSAVGEVVPRLLSVSAEMAELEIQVRRARKRRAKRLAAEAAAAAAAAASHDGTTGGA